jgi:hypothetical protein
MQNLILILTLITTATLLHAQEEEAETAEQENACRSAEEYLDMGAFSRSGLVKQLKFEGYSTEDAIYAVDTVSPDWNEQAEKSAEEYLEMSSFSRSGLVKQLRFEGFTEQQAVHGVNQAYRITKVAQERQ